MSRFISRCVVIAAVAAMSTAQAATAAPRGVQSVDPLIALSLMGTAQSRAAACAAGAAAAAAGSATLAGSAATAQGVAPGCVLPITGPAAPPVVTQTVPGATSGGLGIGTTPLLLGLAAIAALAAVLLLSGGDDDDDPISPA